LVLSREAKKGGSHAAFFFFFLFLLLVAIVDTGKLFPARLGVLRLAVFSALAASLWRGRDNGTEAGLYPLAVGGFALLSLGHAFSSVYVWVSLQHALNIALAAVLLGWTYHTFRKEPDRAWEAAFLAIAGVAVLQSAVAIYQRFGYGSLRPRGTFDNTNFLAEFLAVAGLLCLARLLGKAERTGLRAAWAAGAALFFCVALSLSASRAVLVAVVPAMAVLLLLRYGWKKGGALLLAAGVPALALLGYRTATRFAEADPYSYARLVMWKSAWRTFLSNPFGVGLGGFKYHWFATQAPVEGAFLRHGKYATTAHNEFLEVLAGLGAGGFLLFLVVLLVPVFVAIRRFRGIEDGRKWAAAAAACGLVVSGTHAAFDFNFHEIGLVVLDAILLGALLAFLPPGPSRFRVAVPPWIMRAGAVAALLLLVSTVSTVAGKVAKQIGEKRLHAGDIAGSERMFRLAMAADPLCDEYPDALGALAHRLYRGAAGGSGPDTARAAGLLSEAIRWEGKAVSLSPMDFQKVSRLSRLFAERYRLTGRPEDLRDAIGVAGRALELNPYSAERLWNRADLLLMDGRTDEAIADLARAVSIEPNFCRGYARLSQLFGTSDPAESAAWAEKEQACRKVAETFPLQEYEKWLVESPEE
jgi:O-antigen ligase